MLLQLAVDGPAGLRVLPLLASLVDIVEVGTPLIKRYGVAAVAVCRDLAPGAVLLADTKTVDAGAEEAELFFGAGARILTMLSSAHPSTFHGVAEAAAHHGGRVMVDTILDGEDHGGRIPAAREHVDIAVIHVATDAWRSGGQALSDRLVRVETLRRLGYRVAVAGGVSPANLDTVVAAGPDIIIVGSGITASGDPLAATRSILGRLPAQGVADWLFPRGAQELA